MVEMRNFQFFNFASALIFFVLANINPGLTDGHKVCRTTACQQAGLQLSKSIDSSIDACVDFYEHACHRWNSRHQFPDGQRDFLDDQKISHTVKGMEWNFEGANRTTVEKVINYYKSCTDLATINARSIEPIESFVTTNGGWPLLLSDDDWQKTKQNFTVDKIHKNYMKLADVTALFRFDVQPSMANDGKYLLNLLPPKWLSASNKNVEYSIPSSRNKNETRLAEARFVQKVVMQFARRKGIDISVWDKIGKHIEQMLDFKESLSKLYASESRNTSATRPNYITPTISRLQNKWDNLVGRYPKLAINWLEAIRSAFEGTGIDIAETDRIEIRPKKLVTKLAECLINGTLRSAVNYIHWAAISDLLPYTDKPMRQIVQNFTGNSVNLSDVDQNRRYNCIKNHPMHDGLIHVYTRNHFPDAVKTDVSGIVNAIKAEMKEKIESSSWIDGKAKDRAMEELDLATKNIGYPAWHDQPGKLDEYYSELEIHPHLYFENVINSRKFQSKKWLKKLRQPYDEYVDVSTIVLRDLEGVNFQMPFYHLQRPSVLKFGVIGSLVGPSLARAFVSRVGMAETEDNSDDRSDSMTSRYKQKTKCIADQYVNDRLSPKLIDNSNETNFFSDVIEDNIGFSAALEAYTSFKEKNNLTDIEEQSLKRYSENQLFFYSMINRLCQVGPDNGAPSQNNTRVVDLHKDRINAALANMQTFSDAFQCNSGSPMNPAKKCILWD